MSNQLNAARHVRRYNSAKALPSAITQAFQNTPAFNVAAFDKDTFLHCRGCAKLIRLTSVTKHLKTCDELGLYKQLVNPHYLMLQKKADAAAGNEPEEEEEEEEEQEEPPQSQQQPLPYQKFPGEEEEEMPPLVPQSTNEEEEDEDEKSVVPPDNTPESEDEDVPAPDRKPVVLRGGAKKKKKSKRATTRKPAPAPAPPAATTASTNGVGEEEEATIQAPAPAPAPAPRRKKGLDLSNVRVGSDPDMPQLFSVSDIKQQLTLPNTILVDCNVDPPRPLNVSQESWFAGPPYPKPPNVDDLLWDADAGCMRQLADDFFTQPEEEDRKPSGKPTNGRGKNKRIKTEHGQQTLTQIGFVDQEDKKIANPSPAASTRSKAGRRKNKK